MPLGPPRAGPACAAFLLAPEEGLPAPRAACRLPATGSEWGAPPQTFFPRSLELPRSGVMTLGPSQWPPVLRDFGPGQRPGRFSLHALGSGCWHVGRTLAGGGLGVTVNAPKQSEVPRGASAGSSQSVGPGNTAEESRASSPRRVHGPDREFARPPELPRLQSRSQRAQSWRPCFRSRRLQAGAQRALWA